MRKLLLATAALVALALPSNAAIIGNLGANPTSATGNFENAPGGGLFSDQILFQLIGGPQFLTIASVTNTFAQTSDFITNMNGSVWNFGANNMFDNKAGDDVLVIGPSFATACPITPNCQGFSGGAILNAGLFYLSIDGTAGATAGYAGNLSTAPVPFPLAGAGIPGLLAAFGIGGFFWKRRKVA